MTPFTATRATGEALLQAFIPRMGRRYANGRNTDHGRGAHKAVSVLSPYVRRRLVLEQDLVAAALAAVLPLPQAEATIAASRQLHTIVQAARHASLFHPCIVYAIAPHAAIGLFCRRSMH